MPAKPHFLFHKQSEIATADVVLLSLPYEGTVSYLPGASKVPEALIDASLQLEYYDETYHWEPTLELNLHSASVEPYNRQKTAPKEYIAQVSAFLHSHRPSGFVIGIGGEHTVSYPLVKHALSQGSTVVVFDAHPDLRDSYEGHRFSHAAVMRRLYEDGYHILQAGLSCIDREEVEFLKSAANIRQFWRRDITRPAGREKLLEALSALSGEVYLSIDMDGLSTAIAPGVGTPMPGGFEWWELLDYLECLFSNKNIRVVAADVVELRPLPDNPISEFTAAKLIQKLISMRWKLGSGW